MGPSKEDGATEQHHLGKETAPGEIQTPKQGPQEMMPKEEGTRPNEKGYGREERWVFLPKLQVRIGYGEREASSSSRERLIKRAPRSGVK